VGLNRLHAVPGTVLFSVVAVVSMGLGQVLVIGGVSVLQPDVDAAAWAASHPLLAAGASWLLLIPVIRLLGGWMAASTGEDFGVRSGGRRAFFVGLGLGMAMLLGPALLGRLLGGYAATTSAALTGSAALPALALTLPLLAVMAFGEELLFRGFLMRYWRGLGAKGALVAPALVFTVVHSANPNASVLGGVGVLLAGLMLGVARLVSDGIWLPTGIHLGWNAMAALGVGLPVSGFQLPAIVRWEAAPTELVQGLLGGDFGPEEGLAYHAAWVLGLGAVVLLGPLLGPGGSSAQGPDRDQAQEGPPS
jgi:membrane protease YdiL (CAAX protease family)